MNKKGQIGDGFDILVTVIATVFILLFIGITINQTTNNKIELTVDHTERTSVVDDYLIEQRASVEQGAQLNSEELFKQINEKRDPQKKLNDPEILWTAGR